MPSTQHYVDRIGRLILDWGGYPNPENAEPEELEAFIEALGSSSAPESCRTVGQVAREEI